MPTMENNQPELSEVQHEELHDDSHNFGGAWTMIKLDALKKYLSAYVKALRRKPFTKFYIDAFAGTGRCDVKFDGVRHSIDGSARLALQVDPPFHKYYFIEYDPKKQSALHNLQREHLGMEIEIIHSDANVAIETLCNKYQWRNERAVLFLDPYGMELDWATLVKLSKTPGMDIWYLFPYAGLYRQAAKKATALDASKAAALDRILGTSEWRERFYAPPPQQSLFGDEAHERHAQHSEMLQFVSNRLQQIFPAVVGPKILFQRGDNKNPKGPPLFALYFLLSNPDRKAIDVATNIATHILAS